MSPLLFIKKKVVVILKKKKIQNFLEFVNIKKDKWGVVIYIIKQEEFNRPLILR